MEMFLDYVKAFLVGGAICAIGQIFIDKTKLTPARILTSYVVVGFILTVVGLYEPLVDWAGAGAATPISGFGYVIAKGMEKTVTEQGLIGAITGGFTAAAGGVGAAVVFSFLASLIARPKDK